MTKQELETLTKAFEEMRDKILQSFEKYEQSIEKYEIEINRIIEETTNENN